MPTPSSSDSLEYPQHIWNQIKNITADELVRALERDGWIQDESMGAVLVYLRGDQRVTIHYHPKKTYGPKLLKALLSDIGWDEEDLKRLKLAK